jgi:hypothetical protein
MGRKPSEVVNLGKYAARGTSANAAKSKGKKRPPPHPATSELEYSDDELEFLRAVDKHKVDTHNQFPSWTAVLRIVKSLGYVKPSE